LIDTSSFSFRIDESEAEFDHALASVPGVLAALSAPSDARAQETARRKVTPWLKPEQEEGERQYRAVALRFVEMGNSFLKKLADAGLGELTRMPHALDSEKGFRVRSRFTFEDFIGTAQPPSRYAGSPTSSCCYWRAQSNYKRGSEFLRHLLEVNGSRVQNDVLNRIQESRIASSRDPQAAA